MYQVEGGRWVQAGVVSFGAALGCRYVHILTKRQWNHFIFFHKSIVTTSQMVMQELHLTWTGSAITLE